MSVNRQETGESAFKKWRVEDKLRSSTEREIFNPQAQVSEGSFSIGGWKVVTVSEVEMVIKPDGGWEVIPVSEVEMVDY